jgi:hypothetical protein
MIRVNVGLSRKFTRDFNSTGYSINVEGEVADLRDDPQVILDQIGRLYDTAQDALLQQIDRDRSEEAIASRDVDGAGRNDHASDNPVRRRDPSPGTEDQETGSTCPAAATAKQVAFVKTLAKRKQLSPAQLESVIGDALGHRRAVHELTKSEAAKVIDVLNQPGTGNGRSGR